jgi:hypothetical protein
VITLIRDHVLPAAYAVLPSTMASQRASALLVAIGLQESRFVYRWQERGGPARGFWQFERSGGIDGVMGHPKTHTPLIAALTRLRYARAVDDAYALHEIVEHNDIVACVFARLLLWTLPVRLPERAEADIAYGQYLAAWRPGKPHPNKWDANYAEAWNVVAP